MLNISNTPWVYWKIATCDILNLYAAAYCFDPTIVGGRNYKLTCFLFSLFWPIDIFIALSCEMYHYPGRGDQTEVTLEQTIFERTHVPGALELHGLEKASSAL